MDLANKESHGFLQIREHKMDQENHWIGWHVTKSSVHGSWTHVIIDVAGESVGDVRADQAGR